jgi:hypothetical protein
MLIEEEDVPRLAQAFTDHRLDPIQAAELGVPRRVILMLATASVAQGIANPILLPVLPFLAFMLIVRGLRGKGLQVAITHEDMILLRWPSGASEPETEPTSILASFEPGEIRHAIEAVTPEHLLPSFPLSIKVLLEPETPDGETASILGARLETHLTGRLSPVSSLSRTEAAPVWSGKLSLNLASAQDLRVLTEVILVHFLGKPIRLNVDQKRSVTFLGGAFSMDGTFSVSLSSSTWESMAKELAELIY